ncbi:hypothetical protein C8F04DRAFT_250491 [Mycena alexandri]|uniref:Uncharacterized protein n=1 Tax=Mycena alexandri TaxID=1745969 RepID=A0AAD6XCJ7_9AGAR|nr:hypothetical protein C8F04DRAFT_250491 [Mycena alexandri]
MRVAESLERTPVLRLVRWAIRPAEVTGRFRHQSHASSRFTCDRVSLERRHTALASPRWTTTAPFPLLSALHPHYPVFRMHSIALAELPTGPDAEGPPLDFYLSYPYLLVWTDQVDVWQFSDNSDLTHIATLEDHWHVNKPWGPAPIIDHARGMLILPQPIRIGPPRLRIFTLQDGELVRDIELSFGDLVDVDIHYRKADGHILVLLVEDARALPPHGKTSIVEVDVLDDGARFLSLVTLPPHLDEREKGDTPLVLQPIFFGKNGDIIATSTTRWLGRVDLLYWQAKPGEDDRRLTRTLELLPALEDCKAMLPVRHLALDDSTLVLCTHEDAGPAITEQTSVRALDTSSSTVKWTAQPIPGKIKTLHHIPSLDVLVLSAKQDVTNHDEERDWFQICTAVVVLDARTGDRRILHAVDSDAQGSYVVDCFVSSDLDNPVVGLAWKNGDVLTVDLNKFIADGFEREAGGERARTLPLFPADIIAASMGRKEIVAVAGVKKHPPISEGGTEEDIPDWEEEEGKVMLAKW